MSTTKNLEARIRGFVEDLARQTDEAKSSEKLLDYLRFAARFHRYSLHNSILISFQSPGATHVAGFRTWRKLGRFVKKGERGIAILAPVFRIVSAEGREDEVVRGFRSVYVFDVSQTEGADLPADPVITGESCEAALFPALVKFAESAGITVTCESLGSAYGLSRGGSVAVSDDLSTADRFAVLVHELAHELLGHRDKSLDRKVREIEAETISSVVCGHFCVPCTAPAYLALQGAKSEEILSRLDRIHGVIGSIIAGVETVVEDILLPVAANS